MSKRLVMQCIPASTSRVLVIPAVIFSALLVACANPQRDRYEEVYAAVELEEQRRIEQSQTRRQSNTTRSSSDDAAQPESSAPSLGNTIKAENSPNSKNVESTPEAEKPLNLTIPVTITENTNDAVPTKAWWTQPYQRPSVGSVQCLVTSQALQITDGTQARRVQLVLTEKSIFLRTDAEIDPQAPQAGLRVDANLPFVFERYLNRSIAVAQENYTTILDQLLSGSFVTVTAAFTSKNGVSNLQILEFSLKDFISAFARVDRC